MPFSESSGRPPLMHKLNASLGSSTLQPVEPPSVSRISSFFAPALRELHKPAPLSSGQRASSVRSSLLVFDEEEKGEEEEEFGGLTFDSDKCFFSSSKQHMRFKDQQALALDPSSIQLAWTFQKGTARWVQQLHHRQRRQDLRRALWVILSLR